jgi:VWFA-related protein
MQGRAAQALFAAAFGAAVLATPAVAQVTERQVYVTVLDTSGAVVSGLGTDFFAIREAGRDRDVVRVRTATVPIHIAVLLDTSAFVESAVEPYRAAIGAFVAQMAVGNHVALYEFGERARVMVPFTRDGTALKDAVDRISIRVSAGPRLLDAVDLASADLRAAEARRPVIVAVTIAGTDTSTKSAGTLIKRLIRDGVSLHVVAVSNASAPPVPSLTSASGRSELDRLGRLNQLTAVGEGDRERTQLIEEGSAKTAGALHRIARALAVGNALGRVGAELAATYEVTFSRPGSSKLTDLQVGVMLQDVVVRAIAAPSSSK